MGGLLRFQAEPVEGGGSQLIWELARHLSDEFRRLSGCATTLFSALRPPYSKLRVSTACPMDYQDHFIRCRIHARLLDVLLKLKPQPKTDDGHLRAERRERSVSVFGT